MTLWHFTCDHGYAGLGERGLLRPNPHPLAPELGRIVWLTSDPEPERDDVGLTSEMVLSCDRMAYRYRVTHVSAACVPWTTARGFVNAEFVKVAESFGRPETWWISPLPVSVALDQREQAAA